MKVDAQAGRVIFTIAEMAQVQNRIQALYNQCIADLRETSRAPSSAEVAIELQSIADIAGIQIVTASEQERAITREALSR